MKKYLISAVTIIVILALILAGYYFLNKEEHNKVMTITDVSRNCFSNALVVYDNNTYEVIKGAYTEHENPLIHKGKYNYDIDNLITKIKEYPMDEEHFMNYQVVIENDKTYTVSMNESLELNEFINSLDKDDIFWCS